MRRSLASLGIVTLGVLSMAIKPHQPPPTPPTAPTAAPTPPAPVPTAKKVVTTPPAPPPAPSAPGTAPPAAPVPPAPNSVEKARQGVVVVERQGKPLALGMVLDGDGRILTALSPLANGNFLSARYAD